jgi:hypothetical protein
VDNLSIREPGKFEGEPRWVPYFWEMILNGDGEDFYTDAIEVGPEEWEPSGTLVTYFKVDSDDREEYPELEDVDDVWLWENSQGFVICLTDRDTVAAYFGIPREQVVPCNV